MKRQAALEVRIGERLELRVGTEWVLLQNTGTERQPYFASVRKGQLVYIERGQTAYSALRKLRKLARFT